MNELILIVEDEQDVAELVRYNLEKQGYRTVIADNGERAITVVQCFEPDLVLLDVMLPELNGWGVCETLRASSKGKSLPVIMLTALSAEENRIKGLSLGADDYVSKPFSVRELLLKVGKLLEKRRAITALLKKESEQDSSFRFLVHELKNSVSIIGGFSSLAAAKSDPGRYMGHIASTALHMENLLNDASLLAKLEGGTGSLSREPVFLGELAKDTIETFGAEASARGMTVSLSDAPSAVVWGNKTVIRQILVNLLSNALKYGRQGGRVRIALHERNKWIDIAVRDEGPGIPKNELPKIFDKFYRGAESKTMAGSGLGLFVVKLFAHALGGTVSAASELGKGSTFTVSLGRVRSAQSPPSAAA